MGAKRNWEERDYLAGTQPETEPATFQEAVKEAFRLEHDCQQNQDIAAVLGVDKSRVSQIFADPTSVKPETVQNLLGHLKSRQHRRRIVRAWTYLCFAEDVLDRRRTKLLNGEPTESTLRRVDRMIREHRIPTAAQLAEEAATMATDRAFRQSFLDRAYLARLRLAEYGQAARIARIIAAEGALLKEPRRQATGYVQAARALLALPDATPEEVEPLFEAAERLIAGQPAASATNCLLADERMLHATRANARLGFMERGLVPIDEHELRETLAALLKEAKSARSHQRKFRSYVGASRIHLLLGEPFASRELIDKAFESGEVKNLTAFETCGLLLGRILARTEGAEVACRHFAYVAANCRDSFELLHHELAQAELARLEAGRLPIVGGG